ncbi:DUF1028 domain-containing protein [Actinomadura sp. KC216]|uniref:DUF1028 domain-containing protein n=1 Tax=Actinomadura sp. KC216 TaxID=2530370 RepID=UPI00104E6173|nr:DUF1028 domain-containing protein [Actinomadura sp. KC216]TDB82509.1 DUF1028 domain-containing protein [Actinomadura sp. KC216]
MRSTTFSIVACDPVRREWGVAIASRFLAIGALSAWAEAEVGAVATQSFIHVAHGEEGLRLLAGGTSAAEALDRLLAGDDGRELRQVGIVDAAGRSATYTGSRCMDWAGGRTGDGYAAQGNMLVSAATLDALTSEYESRAGEPLGDRLLAAMEAGQAAGGDRRGQQSAVLRVVREGGGYGGASVVMDLRVDDHERPLVELRRLRGLHELYFGRTPESRWLAVDGDLRAELRERLRSLGHDEGDLAADLFAWAGVENLEERVRGADRIDPVVLTEIRKATSG